MYLRRIPSVVSPTLRLLHRAVLGLILVGTADLRADQPVAEVASFTGHVAHLATGSTHTNGSQCAIAAVSTATLSGLPPSPLAPGQIKGAYLYWSGSGVDDTDVVLDGTLVTADRLYTHSEFFRNWFLGQADVTARVQAKGNGVYSLAGLTIDSSFTYCADTKVVAAWALVVVYEDAALPYATARVWDGFQVFWDSDDDFTVTGLSVSAAPAARFTLLAFEGEANLLHSDERVRFEGSSLSNALNPQDNIYNSTISNLGVGSSNTFTIDLDTFDVSPYLSPGQTSVTVEVRSKDDWVLLGGLALTATSTPSGPQADLSISKSDGVASYTPGEVLTYTIVVTNNGPSVVNGANVEDIFSSKIAAASWTCSASFGSSCSASGSGDIDDTVNIPLGGSVTYTVTAIAASSATGDLVNTAEVEPPFGVVDPVSANDSSTDTDTRVLPVLSGTVLEDVDGDGDLGDGVGAAGVLVRLYGDTNNDGLVGPGDTFVAATVTDGAGAYSFQADPALSGMNYLVTVNSKNVSPSAGLNAGWTQGDVWAEQTYGDDSTTSALDLGPRFGGRDPLVPDQVNTSLTSHLGNVYEHVARVNLGGGSLAGVDFGFSFRVIVHTIDGPDVDPSATRTRQGSLRQLVQNANAIVGADQATIPAGTYFLTIAGISEDLCRTGDLDVTDDLVLYGAGRTLTVIDGSQADRIFHTASAIALGISGLTIQNGLAGMGGGLLCAAGTTTLTNVLVARNEATTRGGGIQVQGTSASVMLSDVVITGNKCDLVGGGLQVQSGTAVLTDVTVSGNQADTGGGIYSQASSGQVTLNRVTISGNTAVAGGGGYYSQAGPSAWTNVTVSGNSAVDGGGLYNFSGDLTLRNVTLADNSATGSGSAIHSKVGPGSVQVANTIVSSAAAVSNCLGPLTVLAFNLDSGNSCGFSGPGQIENADPQLGPLQNNGGLTSTHALLAASPAIDSGSDTGCPAEDQRQVGRAIDGDGNGTVICDIGAVEFNGTIPTADLSITKTDGVASYTPGGLLTYTIQVTNAGPSVVSGAAVTDPLPAEITGASWTCTPTAGASCAASGSGDVNDVVTLPAGASVTYTVNATVSSGATGDLVNTAMVAASAGINDPAPGNNAATDLDTQGAPAADVFVTKSDGVASYTPGGTLTYEIVVTNVGPSDVTGAMVTDTFPAAITSAFWTCVGSVGSLCSASGSGDINDAVKLGAGQSVTYTILASVSSAANGDLANTATVAVPGGATDPDPSNNAATDTDTQGTSSAELGITKTDGVASYTPGGPLTYTIVVTNAGPSDVIGATVADTLPVEITGATWTCAATAGASCAASGSGDIADTVTIPVGQSVTYTVAASVSPSATGDLVNTASVAAPIGTTDPVLGNNAATDTNTQGTSSVDLGITKTDGVASYAAGGSLTYTIVVTNAGPSDVVGATVADTLPVEITGAAWTCVATAGASCTASGSSDIADTVTIPVGQSVTYTIAASVSPSASGDLVNTATVAAPVGTTDPVLGNNSAMDTDTQGTSSVDLGITKTDGVASYAAGGSLTYTIVVTNAGPSDVVGATVADTFPVEITGATWTCAATAGASCTASGSGDIADTVTIPAGQGVTYTIAASVSPSASGDLANTATVAGPVGTTDPVLGNNTATDTDTQGTSSADLGITKTDGVASYAAGGSLTYTIVVTNAGPSDVIGATVADTLPVAIIGATWTCAATAGASCAASGSGDIADTVTIPVGQSVTYTIAASVSPSASGDLVNTATVAAPVGTTDPVLGNNTATDTDTQGTSSADLGITKTDGVASYAAGGSLTYTIVVTNAGPSDVVGAAVVDTFPVEITGVAWTCAATAGASCAASGSGDIADTVTIPVGQSVTYTIAASVSPSASGDLVNTATVAAPVGTTDPVLGNNAATDTDTQGTSSADLGITKTDGVASYAAGGSLTYTIVVTNAGPSDVVGAAVVDTFPVEITGVAWTCAATAGASCAASGSGDIADTVTIPVGQSVTYTIAASVSPSASGDLVNTATVAAPVGTTDPVLGNNAATDTDTQGTSSADLGITKTDGVASYAAGGSLTYTIVVTNAGPSDVVGAAVVDTFPVEITGAAWTCVATAGASCTASGSSDIADTVTIPVGQSVTYTIAASVSPSASGDLANTATVAGPVGTTDPVLGNNAATDTDTQGTSSADLGITKTDGVASYAAGGSLTYTIVVTNAGPSDVIGAGVADTFPVEITGATWTCAATAGASCTASGSGDIADTVTIPAGQGVTYTIAASVSPSASGDLANTATVAGPVGTTDPVLGNNAATDTDTQGTSSADLGITKTDGVASYAAGGSLTYTIVVTNAGPSDVIGAGVADTFPVEITGATWTCAATAGASCTASGSGDIADTVTIPVGQSVTYTIAASVSPSASGDLVNTATVAAPVGTTDPVLGNNAATDTDTQGTSSADLGITKTDGVASYPAGGSLTYTIVVTNAGPSDVIGAGVADTFPVEITGATWTCAATAGASCTASGSGDIADTVTIPVGQSVTYTIAASVSPSASGDLVNTASVAAPVGTTDPVLGNNSASDTDIVVSVVVGFLTTNSLAIAKAAGVTEAVVGDVVPYTIAIRNVGPVEAEWIQIEDRLPSGFKYLPGSARLDGEPMPEPTSQRPLVFEIGTVPVLVDGNANGVADPGEAGYRELTYKLSVSSGALPGTHTNRAVARQPCDACIASNEASARVDVRLDPVFDLGLIVGKVFDDRNANGAQDPGEAGVAAAHVALDDGTYAITDEYGRYHLPALKPGQRMLKIDVRSLPPGSTARDPIRIVWLTPGLMATADFGVAISREVVEIGRPASTGVNVKAQDHGLPVQVQGNADTLSVFVDGQRLLLNSGDARIELEALAPILRLAGESLDQPIVFQLETESLERTVSWELVVQNQKEGIAHRFTGEGSPPASLEWDGRAEDGTMSLKAGIFEYVLSADWSDGTRSRGPIRYFGVDRAQIISLQLTGDAFRFGGDELSDSARDVLARAAETLRKFPNERIVIEGHTDAVGSREANQELSRRRAQSALDYLVQVEKLPQDRFELRPFGEDRPAASNDLEEGRALNRRIVIRGDMEQVDASSIVDLYRAPPYVEVNGEQVSLGEASEFSHQVAGETSTRLDIEIADSQGRLTRAVVDLPRLTLTAPRGEFLVPTGEMRNGCRAAESEPGKTLCRVEGTTEPGNTLEIEGRAVAVDVAGRFGVELPLDEGTHRTDLLVRNPAGLSRVMRLEITVAGRDAQGHRITVDAGIPSLAVELPPSGTKLASASLRVAGRTDPGNRVEVGDHTVEVGPDGRFETQLQLPSGKSLVVVRVTSPEGGTGTVERELEVPRNQIFLLAFADGKIGQIRTKGAVDSSSIEDGLFAEGRLAYYLKGTIAGKYLITSALDTGKDQAEYLFGDLDAEANDRLLRNLDPDKDYPIYGDTGTVVYDAESSGKFFLALDGDEIHAVVGNYPIALTATELASYRRTAYGARFAYVSTSKSAYGAPDTDVVLFANEVKRTHVRDEIQASGGSLYYLSHREVVEGSEHVSLITRDKTTGLTLAVRAQTQNIDYTIKYEEGRILFHRPIASVSEGGSLVNEAILGGHSVSIQVDYDAPVAGLDKRGQGARARRQIGDHLAVGGTYVEGESQSGSYELTGVDLEVRLGAGTRIVAESASSSGNDAQTFVSDNGGVSYTAAPGLLDRDGSAFKLAADIDVGEWFGRPERYRAGAYFKELDPSFVSSGNLSEQGTRKLGFHADLKVTARDAVLLRHDREERLGLLAVGAIEESDTSSLQWQRRYERWGAAAEYFSTTRSDAAGNSIEDQSFLAARGWWKPLPSLSAHLDQQATLSGPANDQTTLGVTYRPSSWLALDASGTHGSIGDSAQVGAVLTHEGGEIYLAERFAEDRSTHRETTVVGARAPIGPTSKVYTEYQWEDTLGGGQLVSLFGVERQWDPAEGMRLVISGEAANVASSTAAGRRRAINTAFSYVRPGVFRAVTSNSVRFDVRVRDLEQWVSASQLDYTLSPDLTLLGRYRYSRTEDRGTGAIEARFDEKSLGAAYRPVAHQRFHSIFRWTRLADERPAGPAGGAAFGRTWAVLSLDTSYRVAPRVEWLAKGALRSTEDAFGSGEGRTQLFVQRFNVDVRKPIEVGVEYRRLRQSTSDDARQGVLMDAGWRLHENFRVGLGFNFTDFTDNLFSENDYSARGWFVRVQGVY